MHKMHKEGSNAEQEQLKGTKLKLSYIKGRNIESLVLRTNQNFEVCYEKY
jgi:hypothetical protein